MGYIIKIKSPSEAGPITEAHWSMVVETEPDLTFFDSEFFKLAAKHGPSGSTLSFCNGEIWSSEDPGEELFKPMIGFVERMDGYLEDGLGKIEPEWYELEWWDDDVRDGLIYLVGFREKHGRDPKDQAEFDAYREDELQKSFEAMQKMAPSLKLRRVRGDGT